jgi:class 3 adenylate cyclase
MVTCPACGQENPDIARFCLACSTALQPSASVEEVRKTVTIVFSDLVGSTSLGERLDSEVLREVMTRYFSEMRRVLERHGGIVEKYIGDAIMAVFGLPRVREDDALRAVRAAAEMGNTLVVLNQELEERWGVQLMHRIGVNTGEVVAGDASTRQRLVTGDAVNVAARLEQAAPAGEVLLGETTRRLVRDRAELQALEPLPLKGKEEAVPAYRLIALRTREAKTPDARRVPLIGRAPELQILSDALDLAIREQRCALVSVLGDAGTGKSRLIDEFATRVSASTEVLRGACPSYGEGATFSALIEALRPVAARNGQPSIEPIEELLQANTARRAITERVAFLLGLFEDPFPVEEIAWAVRKLLEALARRRPVLLALDDLHWSEASLLFIVDHVAEFAEHVPLLLIGAARPGGAELGAFDGAMIELEALGDEDGRALLRHLIGEAEEDSLADRISEAAEGNPLFTEQIVAMLVDDGVLRREGGVLKVRGEIQTLDLPPSIAALLDARLDRLPLHERLTAGRASVMGRTFSRDALLALTPGNEETEFEIALAALESKDLIGTESSDPRGHETLAFRHVLIRDAAYRRMLKRDRAELHELFSDWLEAKGSQLATGYEEVLGFHLEQAYRYRRELALPDERDRTLAERAWSQLTSAGGHSLDVGDVARAVDLFERARSLPAGDPPARFQALADLVEALAKSGDSGGADAVCAEAVAIAEGAQDERLLARARLLGWSSKLRTDPGAVIPLIEPELESMRSIFERDGDTVGLMESWNLVRASHWLRCQMEPARAAALQEIRYARISGDRRREIWSLATLGGANHLGPTPALDAIVEVEELLVACDRDRAVHAFVVSQLAGLVALIGEFDRGRTLAAESRRQLEDLGAKIAAASMSQTLSLIEMLAGDFVRAEKELRRDYDFLEGMEERWDLPTNAALLARALCAQGRLDEGARYAEASERLAVPNDVVSQLLWRSAAGLIAAKQGDIDRGERLARDAVQLGETTDMLMVRGDCAMDLAEVFQLAGHVDDAADAARQALSLYERKGSTVAMEKSRKRIDELVTSG